jgi:hypothetical protein
MASVLTTAIAVYDLAPFRVRRTGDPGLHDMHKTCILMHMRTTLIIDQRLLDEARELTGIREKTALVRAGLEALIAREAGKRLALLGGTQPNLQPAPRRRPA